MKRILLINYEFPPLGGGAANATEQLLKEFSAMEDISVELVTSSLNDQYVRQKFSKNIIIHRLPIGKNEKNLHYQTQKELLVYTWKAYRFARQLCNKKKFDLSHSFFAVPCGVISLLLKWQKNIPYIVSLRGADVPGYSERFVWIYKFFTPLIRRVWKSAAFVVTNSKGLTELATCSAPQQTFVEIFNGIDTQYYVPGHRTPQDRAKEFRILCASRLSFRKGFHDAIDALPAIVETFPHVKMIFAGGDGGVMQKLKGQAQALSVQDHVVFLGHYTKQEAPAIYQNADLFLMPSLNEGMSNNLLEALASGLPVLMTPTGGAQELVKNGKNGFLIGMSNADDIVRNVKKFLRDDVLCERMGKESREVALTMQWQVAAQKYNDLYEKTIQGFSD